MTPLYFPAGPGSLDDTRKVAKKVFGIHLTLHAQRHTACIKAAAYS